MTISILFSTLPTFKVTPSANTVIRLVELPFVKCSLGHLILFQFVFFSKAAKVLLFCAFQDRKMLSAAQQMLQDSRTKIELLRMQMVKISQVKGGELDGSHSTSGVL